VLQIFSVNLLVVGKIINSCYWYGGISCFVTCTENTFRLRCTECRTC